VRLVEKLFVPSMVLGLTGAFLTSHDRELVYIACGDPKDSGLLGFS
jgi:hypothetical protein